MWPSPFSVSAGTSSCAISIGASRLTRRALVSSSAVDLLDRADTGQGGVRDQAVEVAGVPDELLGRSLIGQVGDQNPVALQARPAAFLASSSSSASFRELSTSLAPWPASSSAIARPSPPVAPLSSIRFPSRSTAGT